MSQPNFQDSASVLPDKMAGWSSYKPLTRLWVTEKSGHRKRLGHPTLPTASDTGVDAIRELLCQSPIGIVPSKR